MDQSEYFHRRIDKFVDELMDEATAELDDEEEGIEADAVVSALMAQVAKVAMRTEDPDFAMKQWEMGAHHAWLDKRVKDEMENLVGGDEPLS